MKDLLHRRDFLVRSATGLIGGLLANSEADGFANITVVDPRFTAGGIGWIDPSTLNEPPLIPGNRLRWSYPVEGIAGSPVGLPQRFRVFRAEQSSPVFNPRNDVGSVPTVLTPEAIWRKFDPRQQIRQRSPLIVTVPRMSQAIFFSYSGPKPIHVSVEDDCGLIRSRFELQTTSRFYLERAAIQRLVFSADASIISSIEDAACLDVYNTEPPQANFVQVADIPVVDVFDDQQMTFDQIVRRLAAGRPEGHNPALSTSWSLLRELYLQTKLDASQWNAFRFAVATSWQLSMLAGHAFSDGGATQFAQDLVSNQLTKMSAARLVYRVQAVASGSSSWSNFVYVDDGAAARLDVPVNTSITVCRVTPHITNETTTEELKDAMQHFVLSAEVEIDWRQTHQWASCVEVEQSVVPAPQNWQPPNPSRPCATEFEKLVRVGRSVLPVAIPSLDVRPSVRVRTSDGWDRFSAWSSGLTTGLLLDFKPVPPDLSDADFKSGTTSIRRAAKPWPIPDVAALLQLLGAELNVYRRLALPESVPVDIESVGPAVNGTALIRLNVSPSRRNVGGRLVCSPASFEVIEVSGRDITIELSNAKEVRPTSMANCDAPEVIATDEVPSRGNAYLIANSASADYWTRAASAWPGTIGGLKESFAFSEVTPLPTDKGDVITYAVRVDFGRSPVATVAQYGPFSNIVSIVRVPVEPPPPPPFVVNLLGTDYYGRLYIEIELSKPSTGGQYSVAWGRGRFEKSEKDFEFARSDGVLPPQAPFKERFLYQSFPPPDVHWDDVYYTVGVQGVNSAGMSSPWILREVLIQSQ